MGTGPKTIITVGSYEIQGLCHCEGNAKTYGYCCYHKRSWAQINIPLAKLAPILKFAQSRKPLDTSHRPGPEPCYKLKDVKSETREVATNLLQIRIRKDRRLEHICGRPGKLLHVYYKPKLGLESQGFKSEKQKGYKSSLVPYQFLFSAKIGQKLVHFYTGQGIVICIASCQTNYCGYVVPAPYWFT
ncbi:hypothetical protein VNO77_02293 [Canavalia gladiata]|uniref:Uncharacterized protein n=1 Tax=Canavalia gladiata TaxID=3824 RepID=A0AAN9MXW8_CANGL